MALPILLESVKSLSCEKILVPGPEPDLL